MSKEALQALIGRAVLDSEYRKALLANPAEALAGYELTDEERAALNALDAETLDSLAGTLDERLSKSFGFTSVFGAAGTGAAGTGAAGTGAAGTGAAGTGAAGTGAVGTGAAGTGGVPL
jgi:hypothetical protein